MIEFFKFLLDLLVPRFVVENMAFEKDIEGNLHQICREVDLEPFEPYDEILPVRAFNFFGFGLFPKVLEKTPAEEPVADPGAGSSIRILNENYIDDSDVLDITVSTNSRGEKMLCLGLGHKCNRGGIWLKESELEWLLEEVKKPANSK